MIYQLISENKMTKEEFLEELSLISEYFAWSYNSLYVRGRKRYRTFCPLTAVAFVLKGKNFGINWKQAAIALNLEPALALDIAQASDHGLYAYPELTDLYYRIIEAVDLKVKEKL